MSDRRIALGLFIFPAGHHIGGWRHPDASWRGMEGFAPYRDAVLAAERAKFDFAFLADALGVIAPAPDRSNRFVTPVSQLDPMTLISALAAITSNIGLIATISTTFNQPFHIARKLASLDIVSGGRAGWNVVTSNVTIEALHFGNADILPPEKRYARANEFVEIVFDLWESVERGAFLYDAASGVVMDPEKIHSRSYKGEYFNISGPLDVEASPQGRPLIVQAGTSGPGIALAAKIADVVFSASPTRDSAKAYHAKLKAAVAQAGRTPASCRVMPGLMPIIGTSRQHAEDIKGGYLETVQGDMARIILRRTFGDAVPANIDLSDPPPDELFQGDFSRIKLLREQAQQERFTALDLAKSLSMARGHHVITGTANDVVDLMQDWFEGECADGFNIMPASFMNGLQSFIDLALPELRRRGLFRTDYEDATIRGNLGLKLAERL